MRVPGYWSPMCKLEYAVYHVCQELEPGVFNKGFN